MLRSQSQRYLQLSPHHLSLLSRSERGCTSCQFMLEKEPSGLEKDSSELEQGRNDGHQFMFDADSVPFINLEFDEEEEDAALV